jgi:uncharacterized OB-fold protein
VERPVPVATSVSAEYWRRTAAGELALQWCLGCETWVHYPRGACPRCYSQQLEFRPTSGQGWIYSYSIVHTAGGFPSYADLVPYVVVLVELREGPRLTANLLGSEESEITIGAPVAVEFEQRGKMSLPQFRLVKDA